MSTETLDDLDLDHFRAYNIGPLAMDLNVDLRGPFDEGEFRPAHVISLDHLANPVNKNREGIFDPRHHQTWYRLEVSRRYSEPTRQVSLCNQFGDQELTIGDAELLLLPALKLERGMDPDELDDLELDHFKCYRVLKASGGSMGSVSLVDQFLRDTQRVVTPLFFCAPVAKRFRRGIEEVIRPDAYLTIYEITSREVRRGRTALDQFDEHDLRVVSTAMLAVPTVRTAVESEAGAGDARR